MTTTICSNSEENETKQLIDKRGTTYKRYWVTKLKDGNCWMTQNLALDLARITLTSADSDVSTNWTPNLSSGMWSDTTASAIKYYNPGEYVYTTPTIQNQCDNTTTGLSSCTGKGWQNVSGWTVSNDPTFTMIADTINRTYNAHFLAGNYYTYAAATANTAPSASGTAASSICPKGWQLPTSNSTTASKSFGYMLTQYGLQSNVINTSNGYDIRTAPLYFVYGGNVYNSSLGSAGSYGYYWSSTANGADYAYSPNFSASVTPSNYNVRYSGVSVRCVAR